MYTYLSKAKNIRNRKIYTLKISLEFCQFLVKQQRICAKKEKKNDAIKNISIKKNFVFQQLDSSFANFWQNSNVFIQKK